MSLFPPPPPGGEQRPPSAADGKRQNGGGVDGVVRGIVNSRELIIHRVAPRIPSLGEDRVHEAFNDAVMEWYAKASPRDAPPSHAWLEMATRRNALDTADAERARKAREIRWAQESDVPTTQELYAGGELSEQSQQEAKWKCDRIARLLPDDPMRITFSVWSEDGRNTDQFAEALGIRNGPEVEQAKEVQRHKDRLRKWCSWHRHDPEIRAVLDASFELGDPVPDAPISDFDG